MKIHQVEYPYRQFKNFKIINANSPYYFGALIIRQCLKYLWE